MVGTSWSRVGSTVLALWTAISLLGSPFRSICPMHGAASVAVAAELSAPPGGDHADHAAGHHHDEPSATPSAGQDHASDSGSHHDGEHCGCQWCCTGGPPATPAAPTLRLYLSDASAQRPLRPETTTLRAPRPPPHTLPFATAPPLA